MARSYSGKLYRALNPVYAREPLSGEGGRHYGGRFNPKWGPALYCSLSIMTIVREANQACTLQPTTLVAYEAEIDAIFDGADEVALRPEGMDTAALAASTWRDEMRTAGEARTQAFARTLIANGYSALLVRSFAPGASGQDLNLVLWRWGNTPPARLILIDDEGRLAF
ncbi:MAG TPA: RES domain-containing protein [Rhodopila sp.]|nr:RES domain-containing protein [Rhodopila sp.]